MADVPQEAPESCPGTQSESAGKTSACQGCPNQSACSTGASTGPDPDKQKIDEKLLSVKHRLVVLSGKGGVGKSTTAVMLARALAQDTSRNVALLDIDICGPSIPKMTGLEGEQVHQSGSGWSPVFVEENLAVMSVGFLLSNPEDAVIWRGPRKNGLIKQFLRDVDWGDAEYLVIDTPPGTTDEHLSIIQYLGATTAKAVIVTTPQEVSLLDVRKQINFCKKLGLPIVGVIENMSGFVCPKCKKENQIFVANSGGAERMCKEMGVRLLGQLSLDPAVTRNLDQGRDLFVENKDSRVVKECLAITQRILEST